MIRAILASWQRVKDSLSVADLERAIASGLAESLLTDALLDSAFLPVRVQIRLQVDRAVTWAAKDLPRRGRIDGQLAVNFNVLSPHTITAIRQLDTRVMATLKSDIRESVRAMVEAGLRAGANPRETARHIRGLVGLARNQAEAVDNWRRMLESGDREALTRVLRDHRFDSTLRRALGVNGEGLSATQINKMVAAYEKRMLAFHAEAVSRTATLDALRLGKDLATREAIAAGVLDGDRMFSRWVSAGDERVRPLHVAANGEVVPFGTPFLTTGEIIPGESTWNCRCIRVDFQKREAA
jgi:hypothetical protein